MPRGPFLLTICINKKPNKMRKILVPTDFSDEARIALDFAIQIAGKTSATIKLVHVFEYPVATAYTALDVGGPDPAESEVAREMMDENKTQLTIMGEIARNKNVMVEQEIKIGNPFINISSELKDEDVDLVVMGSKGSSGLDEVLIGSNTEKVVRHAPCPVITVKEPVSIDKIKHIVFATNFKDDKEDLIEHIKDMQRLFNAKLHFVRINTPGYFEPDSFSKKRINKWLSGNSFSNSSTRVYNDLDEEEGIIHYAEEIDANMLALGTHGRTGLGRLFSGSLAEHVVNHAKRPIWTYHIG